MDQRFAICITFPGIEPLDIVNASVKFDVQVLSVESFDPQRDYEKYANSFPMPEGVKMLLLFVFSDEPILTDQPGQLEIALEKSKNILEGSK